jgi:hypothetical protein
MEMSALYNLLAVCVLAALGLSTPGRSSRAEDPDANAARPGSEDNRLSLADLAGYRAALSGRATADDARPTDRPAAVGFRELWERPDAFRGRRVAVRGRVERIFRQGPVGGFPPLAEVWILSTAGDPFCAVFPLAGTSNGGDPGHVRASRPPAADHARDARATGRGPDFQDVDNLGRAASDTQPPGPELGRTVRFTGTFLKMVGYAARDGTRLAPLIVGDRPPRPEPAAAPGGKSAPAGLGALIRAIGGQGAGAGAGADRSAWSPMTWLLGLVALAMLAAVMLARQHRRGAGRRGRTASRDPAAGETAKAAPPLRFVDSPDEAPV